MTAAAAAAAVQASANVPPSLMSRSGVPTSSSMHFDRGSRYPMSKDTRTASRHRDEILEARTRDSDRSDADLSQKKTKAHSPHHQISRRSKPVAVSKSMFNQYAV